MSKTSGKLAAGVRKLKAPAKARAAVDKSAKAPAAVDQAATAPAAPKRAVASFRSALADQHPARIWPD